MPHFLENQTNRRVCIQYTFRRGFNEYAAIKDLRKIGNDEHGNFPVKFDEVQFWFGRFRNGNFDLRLGDELGLLEEEERELAAQKAADQAIYEPERSSSEEDSEPEATEEKQESVENRSFLQEQLDKLDTMSPDSTIDEIFIHANAFLTHNIFLRIRMNNESNCVTYQKQKDGCTIQWANHEEENLEDNYQKLAIFEFITFFEHAMDFKIKVLKVMVEPGDELKRFWNKFFEELKYASFKYHLEELQVQHFDGTLTESIKVMSPVRNCWKLGIARDSFGDDDIAELVEAINYYNWSFKECNITTNQKIGPTISMISKIEKFVIRTEPYRINIRMYH